MIEITMMAVRIGLILGRERGIEKRKIWIEKNKIERYVGSFSGVYN